jgi:aminoglycoside/choline kinase family phosphotransferase
VNYSSSIPADANHWLAEQLNRLELPPTFNEQKLTAEASHRSFSRLRWSSPTTPTSLVFMQSPPALERNDAFVSLAGALGEAGIPVPEVLAQDLDQGWLLLTDVGQRDFYAAYAGSDREAAIASAVGLLPRLQPFRSPDLVIYDRQLVEFELSIFHDWFVGGLLQQAPAPELLEPVWAALIDNFLTQPQVCVHLDYHCRNLLYSTNGTLGVVDFQDARLGPLTYDLASLLRDCYYRLPEPLVQQAVDQFANQLEQPLPALLQRMDLTALQRQLKAIGIFARLQLRDHKATHLKHIAPTLEYAIDLSGNYPATEPLHQYLTSLQEPTQQALAPISKKRESIRESKTGSKAAQKPTNEK